MRRYRRLLLVALVAAPFAAIFAAHGCAANQPFESACDWMAYPGNCYRQFHNDMLAYGQNYPDNLWGDCRTGFPGDPQPTEADPTHAKPGTSNGAFMNRAMLDTCVLTRGGSVTVSPAIDPSMWPPPLLDAPTTYTFTFMTGDMNTCGTVTYTSEHGFSLTVNPPAALGGGCGGSGAGGNTAFTANPCNLQSPNQAGLPKENLEACIEVEAADASTCPIYYGTFSETISPGADAFDVACPNGETHHFNLNEVDGPPTQADGGAFSSCPGLSQTVPQASFQLYPGAVGKPGGMSLAIVFPPECPPTVTPGEPVFDIPAPTSSQSQKIVYFNCEIPAGVDTCVDGAKDGSETDIDCGGPQITPVDPSLAGMCPAGCMVGQGCLYNCDCGTGLVCASNPMSGMLQCAMPAAGVTGVPTPCPYTPGPGRHP